MSKILFLAQENKIHIFKPPCNLLFIIYVVVQFYPWFKFYFPMFWGMVMYDNEFKTKEIKI